MTSKNPVLSMSSLARSLQFLVILQFFAAVKIDNRITNLAGVTAA